MMVNRENGEVPSFDFIQAFENVQDPAVMSELQNLSCQHLNFFGAWVPVFWSTLNRVIDSAEEFLIEALPWVLSVPKTCVLHRFAFGGYGLIWTCLVHRTEQEPPVSSSKAQRLSSRFPLHADLAGPVVLAAQDRSIWWAAAKLGLSRPVIGRSLSCTTYNYFSTHFNTFQRVFLFISTSSGSAGTPSRPSTVAPWNAFWGCQCHAKRCKAVQRELSRSCTKVRRVTKVSTALANSLRFSFGSSFLTFLNTRPSKHEIVNIILELHWQGLWCGYLFNSTIACTRTWRHHDVSICYVLLTTISNCVAGIACGPQRICSLPCLCNDSFTPTETCTEAYR